MHQPHLEVCLVETMAVQPVSIKYGLVSVLSMSGLFVGVQCQKPPKTSETD